MLKVLISSLWFPVTAASEYIYRAFARRKDIEVKTIGSYTAQFIPWGNGGMNLPDKYVFRPDFPLARVDIGTKVPVNYLKAQLKGWQPDLFLSINNGYTVEGKFDKALNATFLTDPHTGLRPIYDSVKAQFDYSFCPQREYSTGREFYLPYAADVEWHRYEKVDEKEYDASIIGNTYPNRVELINQLKSRGLNTFFQLGLAKGDESYIYNRSKCGINWSSMNDVTARVFELGAIGTIPVYNRIPELNDFFNENEHFIGFSSMGEAVEKITEISRNYDKYKHIGENIRKDVLENHTWDNRVQTMLEICKLA